MKQEKRLPESGQPVLLFRLEDQRFLLKSRVAHTSARRIIDIIMHIMPIATIQKEIKKVSIISRDKVKQVYTEG